MQLDGEVDQETRAHVTALAVEFNWKLDRGIAEGFAELVTTDGVFTAAGSERRGRAELATFAQARSEQNKISRTILGLPRLHWNGQEIQGTVPYTLFMHSGEGQPEAQVFAVGEYEDNYRIEDGAWRIASRRSRQVFKR